MNNFAKPTCWRVAEIATMGAIPAVMYRLQETGDPLVILWAAGGILVITCASTIGRALERRMSRLLRLDQSDDDGIVLDEEPRTTLRQESRRRSSPASSRSYWAD